MVKTRTVVQTRTHAQKYFQKVTKSASVDQNGLSSIIDDNEFMIPDANTSQSKRNTYSNTKRARKNVDNASSTSTQKDISRNPRQKRKQLQFHSNYERHEGNYDELNYHDHDGEAEGEEYYDDVEYDGGVDYSRRRHLEQYRDIATPGSPNSPHNHVFPTSSLHVSIDVNNQLPPHFPQPSPAACGKRKHAELAAAQMLAATASQDIEGANVLSMMKDVGGMRSGDSIARQKAGSLSIINPDALGSFGSLKGPETPWENEIRALGARSKGFGDGGSMSLNVPFQVSTPSEQRNFMGKVKDCIVGGNSVELERLLSSAEMSVTTIATPIMSTFGTLVDNNYSSSTSSGTTSSFLGNGTMDSTLKQTPNATTSTKTGVVSKTLNRIKSTGTTILMDTCGIEPDSLHDQSVVLSLCKTLIEHGASVKLNDENGSTSLHYAAKYGYDKVGRLLLNKGCAINTINNQGDAAIHVAAKHGHTEFLQMLAEFGANFHLRNGMAQAALDLVGGDLRDDRRKELRKVLLSAEPRLRTLILYHQDCLQHRFFFFEIQHINK